MQSALGKLRGVLLASGIGGRRKAAQDVLNVWRGWEALRGESVSLVMKLIWRRSGSS